MEDKQKIRELENELLKNIGEKYYDEKLQSELDNISQEIVYNYPYIYSNIAVKYAIEYNLNEFEVYKNKLKSMLLSEKNNKKHQEILESIYYCDIYSKEINEAMLIENWEKIKNNQPNFNQLKQIITLSGNQPSFLSGTRDLCDCMKMNLKINGKENKFLSDIYGEAAKGLYHILLGEKLYQQNDLEKAIIQTTKGIAESIKNHIHEAVCIGYNLLAKISCINIPDDTYLTEFNRINEYINKNNLSYIKNNYIASQIRIEILKKNKKNIVEWINQNEEDILEFNLLDMYKYFTMVRSYIFTKNYSKANLILDKVYDYITTYKRNYYLIEYNMLKSVVMNKLKQKKEALKYIEKALILGQKYRYIRIFADEGQNIYEVLKKYQEKKNNNIDSKYLINVFEETNSFIKKYENQKFNLTKSEIKILKLMEEGYKNQEIAEKLYISKATVKTHINHIYSKMHVKNRVQAIKNFEHTNY